MKTHLFLFAFMVVLTVGRADPSPDEERFLLVPGAQRITPVHGLPVLTGLPGSLVKVLGHYYWGGEESGVPAELRGFTCDLNQDGREEYFLCNHVVSGSGRPYYMVFGEFGGHWRLIGEFEGSIHLFPVREGWPRLVSIGRGGGGIWTKTYSKYEKGKYRETLLERYERGTVTKKYPRKREDG